LSRLSRAALAGVLVVLVVLVEEAANRESQPGGLRDIVGCGVLLDPAVDGLDVARGGQSAGTGSGRVDESLEAAGELGHGGVESVESVEKCRERTMSCCLAAARSQK
jgi:hypothetical protein